MFTMLNVNIKQFVIVKNVMKLMRVRIANLVQYHLCPNDRNLSYKKKNKVLFVFNKNKTSQLSFLPMNNIGIQLVIRFKRKVKVVFIKKSKINVSDFCFLLIFIILFFILIDIFMYCIPYINIFIRCFTCTCMHTGHTNE